jgi:hypothetical protein
MKNVIGLTAIFAVLFFAGSTYGQVLGTSKQVAAPLPKLALLGAESYTRSGKKYHRIVMSVTNWDKYSARMFEIAPAPVLPPNPCANRKVRITAAVFSETGAPMTKCMSFSSPGSMQSFSFLVEKGAVIPKFVYLVLTDAQTGGAYRSNLISPWTGLGK